MDTTSFQIILKQLNDSGERILALPLDDEFFRELTRYQNFLTQIAQITGTMETASDEEMSALKDVQDRHAAIEQKLESAKKAVRDDIMKKNSKGSIDKKYGKPGHGGTTPGAVDEKS